MNDALSTFAYAYGRPTASSILKATPLDFCVEEQIAYPLSGEGEHLWLWVEKINQNSEWVAKQLAHFMGVTNREMGVAGKKDKHAITLQWMSCHLPGKQNPDFSSLEIPGVRVLKAIRHSRKLQTGGLSGNQFQIRLTQFEGDTAEIDAKLTVIQSQGVPNYFGEQRFGTDAQNLVNATRFFQGEIRPKRHQKSLYLSAARSWMFNQVLSERIIQQNWNRRVAGDVFQLDGSQKCFVDDVEAALESRVDSLDIHPTGMLTGRGALLSRGEVATIEQHIMQDNPIWQSGLEQVGLKQERRALRVVPKYLEWVWEDARTLVIRFTLPAGSYATMVVRELTNIKDSTASQ